MRHAGRQQEEGADRRGDWRGAAHPLLGRVLDSCPRYAGVANEEEEEEEEEEEGEEARQVRVFSKYLAPEVEGRMEAARRDHAVKRLVSRATTRGCSRSDLLLRHEHITPR